MFCPLWKASGSPSPKWSVVEEVVCHENILIQIAVLSNKQLPSWELTYPTYGTGQSSSQLPSNGIWYLGSLEGPLLLLDLSRITSLTPYRNRRSKSKPAWSSVGKGVAVVLSFDNSASTEDRRSMLERKYANIIHGIWKKGWISKSLSFPLDHHPKESPLVVDESMNECPVIRGFSHGLWNNLDKKTRVFFSEKVLCSRIKQQINFNTSSIHQLGEGNFGKKKHPPGIHHLSPYVRHLSTSGRSGAVAPLPCAPGGMAWRKFTPWAWIENLRMLDTGSWIYPPPSNGHHQDYFT